jgi:hypothetical protein
MPKIVDLDWWKYRYPRGFEEGILAWCRLMQRGELPLPGTSLSEQPRSNAALRTDDHER